MNNKKIIQIKIRMNGVEKKDSKMSSKLKLLATALNDEFVLSEDLL